MLTAEHVAVNVTDPGHWEAATPLISSTISAALQSAAAPDGEAAVTARGSVQSAAACLRSLQSYTGCNTRCNTCLLV